MLRWVYIRPINAEGPSPGTETRGLRSKDVDVANIAPAEHPSAPLAGEYTRHGGKLTSSTSSTTLLLVHRTATTKAKAHTYVLLVHPDGRRSYVSSLWDSSPAGTYALEYRGVRYALTLTEDRAVLVPVGGGTPQYLNRGSGNSIAA